MPTKRHPAAPVAPSPRPRATPAAAAAPAAKSGARAADATADPLDLPLLERYVGYAVRRAQMRIYDNFFAELAAEDITPARFTALTLIRDHPGLRSTDLAQALSIARSGVAKLVNSFEAQGLVAREDVDADRRTQRLALTPQGRERLARIERAVARHDRRICHGLSAGERAVLLALLDRVAR